MPSSQPKLSPRKRKRVEFDPDWSKNPFSKFGARVWVPASPTSENVEPRLNVINNSAIVKGCLFPDRYAAIPSRCTFNAWDAFSAHVDPIEDDDQVDWNATIGYVPFHKDRNGSTPMPVFPPTRLTPDRVAMHPSIISNFDKPVQHNNQPITLESDTDEEDTDFVAANADHPVSVPALLADPDLLPTTAAVVETKAPWQFEDGLSFSQPVFPTADSPQSVPLDGSPITSTPRDFSKPVSFEDFLAHNPPPSVIPSLSPGALIGTEPTVPKSGSPVLSAAADVLSLAADAVNMTAKSLNGSHGERSTSNSILTNAFKSSHKTVPKRNKGRPQFGLLDQIRASLPPSFSQPVEQPIQRSRTAEMRPASVELDPALIRKRPSETVLDSSSYVSGFDTESQAQRLADIDGLLHVEAEDRLLLETQ